MHRDLKPENVLLDGRRRVKLGTSSRQRVQSSLARFRRLWRRQDTQSSVGGEVLLRHAPLHGAGAVPQLPRQSRRIRRRVSRSTVELCHSVATRSYDNKCDVWSLGCILYDMANDKDRFVHVSRPPHPALNLFFVAAPTDLFGVPRGQDFLGLFQ